jgi:hypothetical protein
MTVQSHLDSTVIVYWAQYYILVYRSYKGATNE